MTAERLMEDISVKPISLDELLARVGKEVGVSPWRAVTQRMIDQFADATDDHQFIHCDPERAARETPFGGTIAHGFLTLSLLSALAFETSRRSKAPIWASTTASTRALRGPGQDRLEHPHPFLPRRRQGAAVGLDPDGAMT